MRRILLASVELMLLTALVLATRCANYEDVFVGGKIYFTDADCYARMTRVRLCAAHPGLIVRHHEFENYPTGTAPHTTAPLDYLILSLSVLLRPFTGQPIDFAGALISPVCGLFGAWFLWWWSRRIGLRFRWILHTLYVVSPPLVHATELGRPDHQSLIVLLVLVALCGEWVLVELDRLSGTFPAVERLSAQDAQTGGRDAHPTRENGSSLTSRRMLEWGMASGAAWALAVWVSAYEPVILFVLVLAGLAVASPRFLVRPERRPGWIVFGAVFLIALLIERRLPSLWILEPSRTFVRWAATIGELQSVLIFSTIWFSYTGYLLLFAPVLIWIGTRTSRNDAPGRSAVPAFVLVLLVATFCLTAWQVRWSCFFALVFALVLPALLESFRSRTAVWIAFLLSILPILRDWDGQITPNESELALRLERRREMIDLRELAVAMMAAERQAFLAPWWLSPALAYWSGQPAVAGSSHEALAGTEATAQFYLTSDPALAWKLLTGHDVDWVVAYDADRTAATSAAILGIATPANPICQVLDRHPAQAPRFLRLLEQNGTAKLYRVANNR